MALLGGILKKIQEAKQELSKFGEQRQKALTVLMSLMDKGVTESQIALLATECWQQHQQQITDGNIQQPLDNIDYGGPSASDYIRLNLLKQNTMNTLVTGAQRVAISLVV